MESKKEFFPDGTPIDSWFYDVKVPKLEELGRQYLLTDYHIMDDGKIHTEEIQAVIDEAAAISSPRLTRSSLPAPMPLILTSAWTFW